jgi:antitoxin component of MazEF toxin-antitoxin module
MEAFEAVPKEWGNSVGITIPRDVVKKAKIVIGKKTTFLAVGVKNQGLWESFGTLKTKKPTQQIMKEIDEGYD